MRPRTPDDLRNLISTAKPRRTETPAIAEVSIVRLWVELRGFEPLTP